MSLITINDIGIISGSITMPKIGVWSADVVIDQPDGTGFDAGTAVKIEGDGITLNGTVVADRTGDFLDAVHVRVLGGAGGMAKLSTPRNFVQPGAFIRDVLNGLTSDSGEKLSSDINNSFLQTNLTAWSTTNQSVSWNLRALLKWLGPSFSWRILDDGTLWMGTESWPSASGTFDILEQHPAQGSFTLGCESPFILPGTSLDGVGNVAHVEHQIVKNRIRSVVSIDLSEGDRGISGSIARMVAVNTAGFDFYALYQCTVVSQSADLATVDVKFQGANANKLAGLQRVPFRSVNGYKTQLAPNTTALLGWDGGNPQSPFACLSAPSDAPQSITFTDSAGDSITISNGHVTVKCANTTVIDASVSSLKLGLIGALPFLYQGSIDSMGVPVTNNPAASASILAGG
jgi:hypothetical protein